MYSPVIEIGFTAICTFTVVAFVPLTGVTSGTTSTDGLIDNDQVNVVPAVALLMNSVRV